MDDYLCGMQILQWCTFVTGMERRNLCISFIDINQTVLQPTGALFSVILSLIHIIILDSKFIPLLIPRLPLQIYSVLLFPSVSLLSSKRAAITF